MNLVLGKILESEACEAIVETIESQVTATLLKGPLSVETVISACDRLVSSLDSATWLPELAQLGIGAALGERGLRQAKTFFSGDALRYRVRKELGADAFAPASYTPPFSQRPVREQLRPLGVLLHIAAGNMDALPAFSVLEGLLAGNINILKLPAQEGGLSVRLLWELIQTEPALAEYIYVFDYSSRDTAHLRKLLSAADGVVVWGGQEAVTAFRQLAKPNVKLIEWGHKLSFAYVTEAGITEAGLRGIAQNIAQTGQLLCSSCQGIFLDTDSGEALDTFCRRFLPVLEAEIAALEQPAELGRQAQSTLQRYTAQLEELYTGSRIFKGRDCSLAAMRDQKLEPAAGFGNVWVKPLPRRQLLSVLRPYKNFLQTAGLLCAGAERDAICDLLAKSGVVKICPGELMSESFCGEAHDGIYPLRQYTKTVTVID